MIASLFKRGYAIEHEKQFRDDFFQNALGTETVLTLASIEWRQRKYFGQ